MTKTTRKAMISVTLAMAVAGSARVADATGAPDPATRSRVRTNAPALTALVQRAAERSTTFRDLVAAINASDGIVYVEEGDCGRGVRACLVTVTAAGPCRILRIKVDTGIADWDLMGSIGHELRHALEVLGDPTVTTNAAMYFFYERKGRRRGSVFETNAAISAGDSVRREVRRPVLEALAR